MRHDGIAASLSSMPATTTVPAELLPKEQCSNAAHVMPALERDHVQKVYDAVATQWHGTRYKAWPRVVDFIAQLAPRSLIADLGCGNGKMALACREHSHQSIGCDFSIELVRIAALQQGLQAQAADVMAVPYRSGIFDAALSIAVLHHISTPERRELLVSETLRVLRPGGVALFYAWAAEQDDGGRSGHQFESSDVFVAFHNRLPKAPKAPKNRNPNSSPEGRQRHSESDHAEADANSRKVSEAQLVAQREEGSGSLGGLAAQEAMGGVFDPSKRSVVFQRYCHVYRKGELRALVLTVGGVQILEEYYDTGNWCLIARKDCG